MKEFTDYSPAEILTQISDRTISPLDLLSHGDLREKLIELTLKEQLPALDYVSSEMLLALKKVLNSKKVDDAKVVVFGGGSGLSNIIGGDSRSVFWSKNPFKGIKEIFPHTRSVVCITDDGGSTGELLKDLPLIAIGDIRHVLLSSIQFSRLQKQYQITNTEAKELAAELAKLFNFRFELEQPTAQQLLNESMVDFNHLPSRLGDWLKDLVSHICSDKRLKNSLRRPQCLGNLLVVASIYKAIPPEYTNQYLADHHEIIEEKIMNGLARMTMMLGVEEYGVMPCTSTPAQLRVQYSNGVQILGEAKSGVAQRGFPVERVFVDYCREPAVYSQVLSAIHEADILVMAPGSLYSSIIPIFQVPQIADAVRNNKKALKLLISNLWVQTGETDLSIIDPKRKFRVSDMLAAYEQNIPGGTTELFNDVLCLSLKDVPASVLQSYAVEGKVPIYLDREVVRNKGYSPIECGIFSKRVLKERNVIQHEPQFLAQVIKTLYIAKKELGLSANLKLQFEDQALVQDISLTCNSMVLSQKYSIIADKISKLIVTIPEEIIPQDDISQLRQQLIDVIWKHHDIPLGHLDCVDGVMGVTLERWHRDQRWDNVFSFYDPKDRFIKIRQDQFYDVAKLEVAFLIALGQSLLGRYSAKKEMKPVMDNGDLLGKVFHLRLAEFEHWGSFLQYEDLVYFLKLSRMTQTSDPDHFTRLISGDEGFTPPGLLMGLLYVWYLDNRMAYYLEYKMSILKIAKSPLIPEQTKMSSRRERLVRFFKEKIFA